MENEEKKLMGIAQLWNNVEELGRRETKERNYINASDIGGSYLDRWYKMKGEQPTNPYEARTLRIFAAGNTFEDLVVEVLAKAEVLVDTQGYIEIPATEKTLLVKGYYDARIGGVKDWNIAKSVFKKRCEIEDGIIKHIEEIYQKEGLKVPAHHYRFSQYMKGQGEKILNGLAELYPGGMPEEAIAEIKSINSNAFWNRKGYIGVGYPHHLLQNYTYLKGTGLKKGLLLYVSKDDLSLEECMIMLGTERIENDWNKDVQEMSAFILSGKQPEPEPMLVFEKDEGKNGLWRPNWKLARSPYLTKITGYPDASTFEKEARVKATPLNRTLGKKK